MHRNWLTCGLFFCFMGLGSLAGLRVAAAEGIVQPQRTAPNRLSHVAQAISVTDTYTVHLGLMAKTTPFPQLTNPDLESASDPSWQQSSTNFGANLIVAQAQLPVPITAHTPVHVAWLGGAPNEQSRLAQRVTIGDEHTQVKLRFWYWIASAEPTCGDDTATAGIDGGAQWTAPLCVSQNTNGWREACIDADGYHGQTITVAVSATLDDSDNSNFFVDDIQFARTCSD